LHYSIRTGRNKESCVGIEDHRIHCVLVSSQVCHKSIFHYVVSKNNFRISFPFLPFHLLLSLHALLFFSFLSLFLSVPSSLFSPPLFSNIHFNDVRITWDHQVSRTRIKRDVICRERAQVYRQFFSDSSYIP
jgi:hypothetical protein